MSAAPPPPPPVPGQPGPHPPGPGQPGPQQPGPHPQPDQGYAPYGRPGPAPASPAAASLAADGKGFFRALFDLKFESFVALKFSAIIYVLYIAYFALIWLGLIIFSFILMSESTGMGVTVLLLTLLLGWIPALLGVIVVRVVIEFLVAGIRTAINTGKLAERP
ncbi:DUF4282 domain-containing protein [Brevibacterium album]|uniref:DUF4282 domain-containing protein n=1 Tax=Brevibacterium album TaxID=417948 RepID=UPI00042716D7|nr:DUF4282 domain-containing protein [Brevibacterium album]